MSHLEWLTDINNTLELIGLINTIFLRCGIFIPVDNKSTVVAIDGSVISLSEKSAISSFSSETILTA